MNDATQRLTYLLIAALIVAIGRWIGDAIATFEPGSAATWMMADTVVAILIGMALIQVRRTAGPEDAASAKRGTGIAVAGLVLGIAVAVGTVGIAAWQVVHSD
jgi:hypothetical protein